MNENLNENEMMSLDGDVGAESSQRPRKARADSPLWSLPEQARAELMEFMGSHTLKEAQDLLKEKHEITISLSGLSRFRGAYEERRMSAEEAGTMEAIVEGERARRRGENEGGGEAAISEDEIFAYGQRRFATLAIRTGNGLAWQRMQRLRQNEERLGLEDRRVHLLEEKARRADATEQVAASPLSPEEKEARIKEIFGIT